MTDLDLATVHQAAERIAGRIRACPLLPVGDRGPGRLAYAAEFLQHTGSFKARGALNFIEAHRQDGAIPAPGVAIASGGNAGLACAWAARESGVPATVFLPTTAPAVKLARLRGYGAEVVSVGTRYADALAASMEFADRSGALLSHAYDHPLIAAGAGTLLLDLIAASPTGIDTVVVSVGGGGLFAGLATVAAAHGIRLVAVEPATCRALHAALAAGHPVDVEVNSIAADSLGATRATPLALAAAAGTDVRSILVTDEEIVAARRSLWAEHRLAVEHAAATALAGLTGGEYRAEPDERVVVILCGPTPIPAICSSRPDRPAEAGQTRPDGPCYSDG